MKKRKIKPKKKKIVEKNIDEEVVEKKKKFVPEGRPKGVKNRKKENVETARAQLVQRVLRCKNSLLTAQIALARGVNMLFCKKENGSFEIVKDQKKITAFLAGELDDSENYLITTQKPDNTAIESLFNRVFGKPMQSIVANVTTFDISKVSTDKIDPIEAEGALVQYLSSQNNKDNSASS